MDDELILYGVKRNSEKEIFMVPKFKYVKLIAKPDTWFDEGTEVWSYDKSTRLAIEEYEGYKHMLLVRGYKTGDDGITDIDGECCDSDEFELSYTNDPTPER